MLAVNQPCQCVSPVVSLYMICIGELNALFDFVCIAQFERGSMWGLMLAFFL